MRNTKARTEDTESKHSGYGSGDGYPTWWVSSVGTVAYPPELWPLVWAEPATKGWTGHARIGGGVTVGAPRNTPNRAVDQLLDTLITFGLVTARQATEVVAYRRGEMSHPQRLLGATNQPEPGHEPRPTGRKKDYAMTPHASERPAEPPILAFFEYAHLPNPRLRDVSRPFHELAHALVDQLPDCAERNAGLRKLLEAKDCAVRAAL